METKKYIDLLGKDFTEYMTSPEQIELFNKMCEAEERTKRPIKESYMDVIEVLNLEAKIMGKPKRAFFQAGPSLN